MLDVGDPKNDESPVAAEPSQENKSHDTSAIMNAGAGAGNTGPVRYGATLAAWRHFGTHLALQPHLLPVVSNPNAVISPRSSLAQRGKVPSVYDRNRQVVGIGKWTEKVSTAADIATWRAEPDYGICVQTTGEVRAIDVDISDPVLAALVQAAIEGHLGKKLPRRYRANSAKFLCPVRVPGARRKRVINVANGEKIELLADGQQFIAAGTHPSGARYQWDDGLPPEIPELTPAEFDSLVEMLAESFGVGEQRTPHDSAGKAATAGTAGSSHAAGAGKTAGADPDDFMAGAQRLATLARITPETLADIRSALDFLPIPDADDYGTWINEIGFGLKSVAQAGYADQALEMWLKFSAKSAQYKRAEAVRKWEGFDPDEKTYLSILDRAQRAGWKNPKAKEAVTAENRVDRTDAGNLAVMADQTAGDLLYVSETNAWIRHVSGRWESDPHGHYAQAAALEVGEHYLTKARELGEKARDGSLSDNERKDLEKAADSLRRWAEISRNKRAIDAMLGLAKRDHRFAVSITMLDQDPNLFGVANGVVDLRTGALHPDSRDQLVTKRSPVAFNPQANAPRWGQFVNEITARPLPGGGYAPRPALALYLHQMLGYCMTGLVREHKMFIAIGDGSNGKSVLFDAVKWIMGDYAALIEPEALMASKFGADGERATPAMRKLAGARLVTSSESKQGQQFDDAVVKKLTGGDELQARALHENPFKFKPTHKIAMQTNHKPQVGHMDEAMRGRLHMIPFDMRYNRPGHPDRSPNRPDGDKTLADTLKAEAEGILAWLVEGAVMYYAQGLAPPEEVASMTREYFQSQDAFGLWLATRERCDPKVGTSAGTLFDEYRAWCDDQGHESGATSTQTAFSKALQAREVLSAKTRTGRHYGLTPSMLADVEDIF